MIPKGFGGRRTGTGGGGQGSTSASTPFWCKKCGKTIGRKNVVGQCVDMCKKCRLKK